MPEIVVAAESRTDTGKNANRRLRAAGKIPGILYGTGRSPTPVAVSPKDIGGILRSATGTRRKVILKECQLEPVRNRLLHADFYEVALDKALEVKVHVELRGTPVGVKTQGGILDFVTRELEISCLPMDIPGKIEVDVSYLEMGKHLRVSEIKIPERVKILTDPDVVIANVVAPRAEEEVAPAAEAAAPVEGEAAASEPEVIKKGKAPEAEAEAKAEKPEKKEKK
jgi:large subunit ribosomal protein L25